MPDIKIKIESDSSSSSGLVIMSTIGSLRPFEPPVDDIEVWINTYESYLMANVDVLASAIAQEAAVKSTALVRGEHQSSISKEKQVNKTSTSRSQPQNQRKKKNNNQQQNKGSSGKSGNNHSNENECSRCGSKKHQQKSCPHKETAECYGCGKKGHFKNKCRTPSRSDNRLLDTDLVRDLRSVNSQLQRKQKKILLPVMIGEVEHNIELDTGCETSILSEEFWKNSLGAPKLQKSSFDNKERCPLKTKPEQQWGPFFINNVKWTCISTKGCEGSYVSPEYTASAKWPPCYYA
ncbi:unnamed protein product [Orchesella dallaii]|uniref:CCHC-type domain-containing protein n=1 Tax=Orchesella dallaii TaxID=48710 RepID=A0ABP1PKA0_9HEXA